MQIDRSAAAQAMSRPAAPYFIHELDNTGANRWAAGRPSLGIVDQAPSWAHACDLAGTLEQKNPGRAFRESPLSVAEYNEPERLADEKRRALEPTGQESWAYL